MVFRKKSHAGKKAFILMIVVILANFVAYYTYQFMIGNVPTIAESALFVAWHVLIEGIIIFIAAYILLEMHGR